MNIKYAEQIYKLFFDIAPHWATVYRSSEFKINVIQVAKKYPNLGNQISMLAGSALNKNNQFEEFCADLTKLDWDVDKYFDVVELAVKICSEIRLGNYEKSLLLLPKDCALFSESQLVEVINKAIAEKKAKEDELSRRVALEYLEKIVRNNEAEKAIELIQSQYAELFANFDVNAFISAIHTQKRLEEERDAERIFSSLLVEMKYQEAENFGLSHPELLLGVNTVISRIKSIKRIHRRKLAESWFYEEVKNYELLRSDTSHWTNNVNRNFLGVLKWNSKKSSIELGEELVKHPLQPVILEAEQIWESSKSAIKLLNYLLLHPEILILKGKFRYAEHLNKPYQDVIADMDEALMMIRRCIEDAILRDDSSVFDSEFNDFDSSYLIDGALKQVKLWEMAYSLNQTYRICHNNSNILTFTHRLTGWAAPVYKLTNEISFQLLTNFGYGQSSYFLSRLYFKDIPIIPYSEIIEYRYRNASDVIRYFRKYPIKNDSWHLALIQAQNAVNLSLTSINDFVEIFLIFEMEKMIEGLEGLLTKDVGYFKDEVGGSSRFDLKGRSLLLFRAEKVVGAIDFIESIRSIEELINCENFSDRLVELNIRLAPLLINELSVVDQEIYLLTNSLAEAQSQLIPLALKYKAANKLRIDFLEKIEPLACDELSCVDDGILDYSLRQRQFNELNPWFISLQSQYVGASKNISQLEEQLLNSKQARQSIDEYINKIACVNHENTSMNQKDDGSMLRSVEN